MRDIKN